MPFSLTQGFSQRPSVGRILLLAAAVLFAFVTGVGSVTAQTADDHGDDINNATNLPLGSSVAGRIDPGDDRDIFKLDLSGASGNTHVWVYTTGELDTLGGLYDSNGNLLTSNDDTTSGSEVIDTNFRIPWTLAPGVYYVSVRSADRMATGDYTLHAEADDHGQSFDTATTLLLGDSTAGRIDPEYDRDVFKLDLSGTSGTTDVWIYTTGELDTRGWLYDSNEGLLVFNNDSYIVGREDGFNLRRNLSSGVYYLSVRSWAGAIGDYTLHAEAVADPGNTTGTATTLNLDLPTPGMIDTAGDSDYFRFVLAESKNLVIYALSSGFHDETRDLLLREPLHGTVLDDTGADISVNVRDVGIGFEIMDDFDPGTYYIKVTVPRSDATYPVPYTIHAYEDTDYTEFIDDCEAATAALSNPQINDSLYGCQWHLRNQERGGEDINVEAVWVEGINGAGVNVAVVDDGMYYAHEDLAPNVDTALNHNYDTGNRDSRDIYGRYEHHGTAVAGVIAAQDNGIGVRGVAPRATVYGYNYLAGDWQQFEDRNRADAMSRNRVVTAISNNSWGPVDGPWLGLANRLWELAIDSGIREGYEGKGVFYVFAGGNGGAGHRENPDGTLVGGHFDNVRKRGDNSNLDELANYYAVTAVCAVNDGDVRSVYSEKGANLWVCAPSRDDGEHRGIVTTENSDRYRSKFGGTSAAAPIVSGVAALLRQANPDLTWRDLKLILAASARENDAANSGWLGGARKYGSGSATDRYHFNHEYGFGVVDAKAAVDIARGWTNVPPLESVSVASEAEVAIPPPSGSIPETVTTTLTLNTGIRFTEFVEVNTDFEHTSFRDMDIELVSPSGSVSKLTVPFNTRHYTATYRRSDGSTFDAPYWVLLDGEFRFGSARHLGEDPNGQWTLRLTDHFPEFGGALRAWSIKVYGHPRDVSMASPDREVVVSLYNATDGPNWANNTNWLSDRPPGEWHGVTIDADGRVTRLNLSNNQLSGEIPSSMGSLTNLEELWLADNQLTGEIPPELGNLANLDELYLWGNELTGEIPVELGTLANLTSLSLSQNQLTGAIPTELGSLANLEELYLWGNELTGMIPAELGSLANLGELSLSDNQLTGEIPVELGILANLKELWLSENQLIGEIPVELRSLSNLVKLVLWGNQLTGEIPSELGTLANLTSLSLSQNQLTGTIPTWLGSLANLEELYLWGNELTGEIPSELGSLVNMVELHLADNQLTGEVPVELGNLTNLKVLALGGNELTGTIPTWLGSLANMVELRLADNQLAGEIPVDLGTLANLTSLSLSQNQLTGAIPTELGSLAKLKELWLSENQLTGEIPVELGSLSDLVKLGLWGNELTGAIPTELGSLAKLKELWLSENQLTGEIPVELGRLANLEELYLWGNELTGTIPTELGSLANLEELSLSDNQLTGEIPVELGSLSNFVKLYLWGNELTGTIPTELGSLANLEELSLSDNQLTGEIPVELGSLSDLVKLVLWGNELTGEIPVDLGTLANLTLLNLSQNQLTGTIPTELGSLANLEVLSLSDNQLSGVVPQTLAGLTMLEIFSFYNNLGLCAPVDDTFQTWLREISIVYGSSCAPEDSPEDRVVLVQAHSATDGANWTNNTNWLSDEHSIREWYGVTIDANGRVNGLFLGDNQLAGEIPADLESLTELEWAFLSQNQLTGEIPSELGSLVNLRSLSLGDNHLTGEIPSELGNLTNLVHLRLDGNQLTGEIPVVLGRLTNLTVLHLSGNRLTGCVPASLRDVADNDFAELELPFCTSQDPLITLYDTNHNGKIDRSEVIKAIKDYLSGEGDTITRVEVIRLIKLYLGGPPAAQQSEASEEPDGGQRADADRPVVESGPQRRGSGHHRLAE